jgi:hypothetical protein
LARLGSISWSRTSAGFSPYLEAEELGGRRSSMETKPQPWQPSVVVDFYKLRFVAARLRYVGAT